MMLSHLRPRNVAISAICFSPLGNWLDVRHVKHAEDGCDDGVCCLVCGLIGEWGDVGEREHTEAAEPGGELDDGSVGVESTGRVPDEENRLGSSGRIDGEARDRAGSGGWAVSG